MYKHSVIINLQHRELLKGFIFVKSIFKLFIYQAITLLWAYRKIGYNNKKNGEIKSILIVEIALLGDVVSISPLIKLLKEQYNNASIAILVKTPYSPLLESNPYINKIFNLDGKGLKNILNCISKHDFGNPDIVISASPGINNSLAALLIGKKEISGYLRNFSFKTYYYQDHFVEALGINGRWKYGKDEHITTRALKTAIPLGLNNFSAEISAEQSCLFIDKLKEEYYLDKLVESIDFSIDDTNIVIHPAASQDHRQWPLDSFIDLFDQLSDRIGRSTLKIILVGIGSERDLHQVLIEKTSANIVSLIEKDLLFTMTVIKNSNLFIGSDSGPKHIADGFSTPIIELLGPMKPDAVQAIGQESVTLYKDVGCNPCAQQGCDFGGKCVQAIKIDEVYKAACSLLNV